ncbi:hypothetical protein GCM10018783_73920 [Streptomyces griseosporeus]|nr:hypothetical protein GCM10018783_73920 [Streptomyces griseosporeus]
MQRGDVKVNRHERRIRHLKAVSDLIETLIADEVRIATSKPEDDPTRLSWNDIARIFEKSKTAVYTKYGAKK